MGDRGNKFIDSAFTISTGNTTCKNPSYFYHPSTKSSSSSTSSDNTILPPRQVSFKSSLLHGSTMSAALSTSSSASATVQFNHDERERESSVSTVNSICDDEDDNQPTSFTSNCNNHFFTPIPTTIPNCTPIITDSVEGINLGEGEEHNGMEAGLLHHRSRIKAYYLSSRRSTEETPLAKQIESGEKVESCGKSWRRGRRRRSSSTNPSTFTSTTISASSSITTNSTTSTSSPSRFLLTFLSSCHLVQVTSRLVVALAMTSLFLILMHVMPGAYCSSSTSIYSQAAAAAAAASSSTTSITTGAQHHHATKRAYFNQSVLTQLKIYKTFQPLSSSSSSFVAGGNSELSGGGGGGGGDRGVGVRGGHQRTWLKTRWPLTVKSSASTVDDDANDINLNNADDFQVGNIVVGSGDVVNVNNKPYSNQLAVNNMINNNNNDYVDNQQQNNIVVLHNNNGNNKNHNLDDGGNISAKNNLVTNNKSSVKMDKSTTIESMNINNNYDYYNNGNNNNNRSNYNYYDTSFVNVESTSSSHSQSTSSLLTLQNKSSDNNKNYIDNSEKTVDNNTQQQQQSKPMNRGSNSIIYDSNDEDLMTRQEKHRLHQSSDLTEISDNDQRDRASTAKVDRSHSSGSNNGTTKAERDTIVNASSTGVRPTMAFTNSYFGRSPQHSFDAAGDKEDMSHNSDFGGEEDEIYGIHDDDKYADVMQSDTPSHYHHFSREDSKQSTKQGRRGRPISVKNDNDGDDGNEEKDEDFTRRRKKSWREDTNDKDEFLHLVSFSSGSYRQQQGKSSASSGPTASTATTTTITDATSGVVQRGGKLFALKQQSSISRHGDGAGNSVSSGESFLGDPTASFLSSSPSSPSSSSSKLKSIKFSSTSSFSTSNGNNNEQHLIPSSSTATLHYPNENGSSRDDVLVGDGGESSSVRKTLSPSSSSSTLSNHNLLVHHNHHYHQPQHQRELEEHQYNEVFRFGAPPPAVDAYEDEVIVDDNNDVLEENEDINSAMQVGGQERISNDNDKTSTKSTSSTKTTSGNDNSVRESTSYLKQRTANKYKLSNSQQQSHHHVVLPTIFGELSNNDRDALAREEVELITNNKNHFDNHHPELAPTVPATALRTFPDNREYPHRSANGISNFNENNNNVKQTTEVEDDEEQLMLGDDPSIVGHDDLFGSSGASRIGSTSSNPLSKNINTSSSSSSASTTASTFGGASVKQKGPLQIRRDLSRLIASASGKGVNGNGASSLVGDDEEPMPNKCDRLFMWNGTHGSPNGTFESPTMVSEEGHLYQCIFMFLAEPMQRVEVVFTQFSVRGTPPECVHEWVDIWTEVEGTDPTDLVTTPFSGRYCGKIPPRRRISLYGGIAIGFYSDKNSTDETIFRGTFAFINNTPYQIGTPVPRTLCSYTIQGASKRNGDLISPTYPGVYPKNLSCSYKFIGIEGQRIRLEFRDFDVFYGGAHCPFDEVKVYDGMDPTAPLIGTYCGQQRNLVVFSSAHLMLVTFTTLERSTEAQNRGFKGVWEFSESFVKLDFIEKNMGTHIRGTECDQRILSKGQSSGVVYSPNYPFPYVPKIVCRYFIYGLQDPQHLERVRLSFEKFDVITNINSEEDTANQSEPKKCGDGFLKVYLKGQEVIQAYDKADYEFCGKEAPHDVVSDGPRLVLVFSSGETVGSGFKGRYQFETEYRVPGTAAPDGSCHFTYYSSSRMKGEFNSPRFPSNYPSTTNCTYIFFQQPNEQVRIVFDNFKMRSDKFNYTDRGAYGELCDEDWVEVWNVISDAEDRLVGRYCGSTAPGPIESREKASALKVILHTDEEGVSSGFKARYIYFTAKTIFGECGQNITQAQSGVLTSPKWPQKYDGPSKGEGSATCNWYLSVRPGSRVMLHFQNFAIEGEPNGRGCPAAAVRIWVDPDGVPVELCGEALTVENSQYVSARNLMRVTFITADKAVGAPGFRAVWTEVQERISTSTPCHHSYFRCEKSLFCIPAELRCDGVENCGTNEGETDMSDEQQCGLEFGDMNTVIAIIIGVAISLFFIVLLCAWGQRRKRRRRRRLQLRRPPIHVCDNAGARFAAMDSV